MSQFHLIQNVAGLLTQKTLKIAVAESCTGGLLSSELTQLAGASEYFDRGFVTYSNESKQELLGVPDNILKNYGAVSIETASAMALGALLASHADIAASITGIAGPAGGSIEKPVGFVCFGLANRTGFCSTKTAHFSGDRNAIREQSVEFILHAILDYLRA